MLKADACPLRPELDPASDGSGEPDHTTRLLLMLPESGPRMPRATSDKTACLVGFAVWRAKISVPIVTLFNLLSRPDCSKIRRQEMQLPNPK